MTTTAVSMALIPSLSECDPGIRPVEFNVLIAPEEAMKKVGSIILTDAAVHADQQASQRGRLIAVSPAAFDFAKAFDNPDMRPKVGDLVQFAKYAGVEVEGRDGRKYRLCKDENIAAVIEGLAA